LSKLKESVTKKKQELWEQVVQLISLKKLIARNQSRCLERSKRIELPFVVLGLRISYKSNKK